MPKHVVNSGIRDWKPSQLPDLVGKHFVITGANSGIGYQAARLLGEAGADLTLACRSMDKAETARANLSGSVRGAIDLVQLDLSDLASVRTAAKDVRGRLDRIDGLVNNAGIMQTPQTLTRDGFDLQMGANHLGHFLWTALLIDLVEAAKGRVVAISSIAHKFGTLDFDDLMTSKDYDPSRAYFRSKLANLIFAFELDRRLKEAGSDAIAIACHPGYSSTNLQSTGPTGMMSVLYKVLNPLLAQSQEAGAIPTVLAAAGSEAKRGAYYGPQRMQEARGPVGDALVADHALDKQSWARLWQMSEELVGQKFVMPAQRQQTERAQSSNRDRIGGHEVIGLAGSAAHSCNEAA